MIRNSCAYRLVVFSAVLFLAAGCDDGQPDLELGGVPSRILAGQTFPEITVRGAAEGATVSVSLLKPGTANTVELLGTTDRPTVDGGAVFDDLLTLNSGQYVIHVSGKNSENKVSAADWVLTVQTPNAAEISCQSDGSVKAWAASQNPLPFKLGFGTCSINRGGGNLQPSSVGIVTCSTPLGSVSCQSIDGGCFNPGTGALWSIGDSVNVSWDGGQVPGSASVVVVPADLTVSAPAGVQSRKTPWVLTFSGGSDGGWVTFTLSQQVGGSTLSAVCDVPANAGSLTLPASLLGMFSAGDATLSAKNRGVSRIFSAGFALDVDALGKVTGPLSSETTVTLQ